MKKLILKTALITFGVTLIMAVSVFGIVSFCAPSAMMSLTASLGMESVSGDYAYQEYQHSKDIAYLARAYEIAAAKGNDGVALERFTELTSEANLVAFEEYCTSQESTQTASDAASPSYSYRDYIFGTAARVKYRLARTDDDKEAVYSFAAENTKEGTFAEGNPVQYLCTAAAEAKDQLFCSFLLANVKKMEIGEENENYDNYMGIVNVLEEVVGNE